MPLKQERPSTKSREQTLAALANTLQLEKTSPSAALSNNPLMPVLPCEQVVDKHVSLLEMNEYMYGDLNIREVQTYMRATTYQAMQAQLNHLFWDRRTGKP